jgi:long-chain acyl-CoA synthetase
MDPIALHAARQPDRPAIIDETRTLTWETFRAQRDRLARALGALGLGAGEHVAIYAGNSAETLLAGAATRAVGALPVPINHRLTADEVAYILDDADATAAFVGDGFVPVVERVREGARSVRHWILIGDERRAWAEHIADLLDWSARSAERESAAPSAPSAQLGGSVIYTAGTTGHPKGARRVVTDAQDVLPRLAALGVADPAHVHLVAGPLYHSAPGGFAAFAHLLGQTVVIMRRFDPGNALATIEQYRCTSTFMAPTLLQRIVDLPPDVRARHDVSSMRAIVMAAAPCPMRVKEAGLRLFGPVLYEFYGSTELGINTILRPDEMLARPGSCGRAAPGIELAVLGDDGQPVPAGQPGELFVRRYAGAFDGYYKNPEATRQTARGDWLSVGDVAWMDADGYVYICDRKRDMIISGGVNIYPAEIEDVLHRHPAVADVAVFGVPDDEWGERVHAAVQLRPDARATSADLIEFARARLADYKTPRDVSFHETFPRDAAGKLVKRVLREPHWAGRATRV